MLSIREKFGLDYLISSEGVREKSELEYLASSCSYIILYLAGASVHRFWSAPCLREVAEKALGDLEDDGTETTGEFRQALVEMLDHPALYTERAVTKISCYSETSLVLLVI